MLKPTSVAVSRTLRPKRLTVAEIDEIIAVATVDCDQVVTTATWRGGEVTATSELDDLSEIHRPQDLTSLHLQVTYIDHSTLTLRLVNDFVQTAHASTGTALTRLHHIASRYSALPGRRMLLLLARIALYLCIVVAPAVTWALLARAVDLNNKSLALVLVFSAAYFALVWIGGWRIGTWILDRIPVRTTIIAPNLEWYQNPTFVIPLLGTTATAATTTVTVITFLTR